MLADASVAGSVRALPPGARAVGWSAQRSGLIVEWPGSWRRVVRITGETRAPFRKEAATDGEVGAFRVRDGVLLWDGAEEPRAVYPPAADEGESGVVCGVDCSGGAPRRPWRSFTGPSKPTT